MSDHQRLAARISGRVQGVGFRYWTLRQAVSLGLAGWVMNLDAENALQVVAEGEPVALDALERLLRQGPPGAHVDRVDIRREPASGEFTRFSISRQ